MRILFCNIAWMKYYKGNYDGKDMPSGGGSYVDQTHQAHEEFNFQAEELNIDGLIEPGKYCLGFVETKSTNGVSSNQLKIESIVGCEDCKKEESVEDVIVVFCAKYPNSEVHETLVVGWYEHASVYRNYQFIDFLDENGEVGYTQAYNILAKAEDCVLLPTGIRRRGNIWNVPRKKRGISYGFGQANVWFANEFGNDRLDEYLSRLVEQIKNYDGENWIDSHPCNSW